jgi:adenylate kinase family enzyme
MSKPILLLSGVPGSGKSCYGRWLAKNKAYLHLDLEHGDLERHGLERCGMSFGHRVPTV